MDEAIQVVIEIGQGGDHNPAKTGGNTADSAVTAATSTPPPTVTGSGKCAGYYSLASLKSLTSPLSITSIPLSIAFLPCMICAGRPQSHSHTPLRVGTLLRCTVC